MYDSDIAIPKVISEIYNNTVFIINQLFKKDKCNMTQLIEGIHCSVPHENITAQARKLRDFYALKPRAPLIHKEFGYYCLDRWYEEGLNKDCDFKEFFGYDDVALHALTDLGWVEAEFYPRFDVKIIEKRDDDTEVEQDFAGRHVLYFKDRRNGFMPEYLDHPVKDLKSWEENVKWRLNPETSERLKVIKGSADAAVAAAKRGEVICQRLIGGYMYLRSLIGPEELFYMFIDKPELIHDCMKTWLKLADAVTTKYQQYVTYDEIFFAEDICYNHGSLISPDMMKEFLTPYYQQLVTNVKSRQLDKTRRLFIQVDTDGFCDPVIPIYQEAIGMDYMSPFEVASKCDVVRTGKEYPELLISGGIDKRILAKSKDAIDRELDRIIPTMMERGGYIPTCDHGVPEEVSLENYMHYRKRMLEYSPLNPAGTV